MVSLDLQHTLSMPGSASHGYQGCLSRTYRLPSLIPGDGDKGDDAEVKCTGSRQISRESLRHDAFERVYELRLIGKHDRKLMAGCFCPKRHGCYEELC